jgi:hypothetical protein
VSEHPHPIIFYQSAAVVRGITSGQRVELVFDFLRNFQVDPGGLGTSRLSHP